MKGSKKRIFAGTVATCIAALMLVALSITTPMTGAKWPSPTPTPSTTFTLLTDYSWQFQWRGTNPTNYPGGPFTDWSAIQDNGPTASGDASVYTLKGSTLTTLMTYSPSVTNVKGGQMNYYRQDGSNIWVLQKTEVDYNYATAYGSYRVANYFCGYLKFNGVPSDATFAHGVTYQWIYLYARQTDSGVLVQCPNAIWDPQMHAWQVGLSIYFDDPAYVAYTLQFPNPDFPIEPVPVSDFNSLHL